MIITRFMKQDWFARLDALGRLKAPSASKKQQNAFLA